MKSRTTSGAPSRRWCLAASLGLHLVLAAGWGLALALEPPRLAPEAGAGGFTVTVVPLQAEAVMPWTDTPEVVEPPQEEMLRGLSEAVQTGKSAMPEASATAPVGRVPVLPPPVSPAMPSMRAKGGEAAAGAGAWAPPSAVHCPAPPYPVAARRAGREGAVRLRVVIAPNGRVKQAEVVESSGRRDMDEAALRTILREWRYEPARRGGVAVAAEETVRIEFRLRG